MSAAARIIAEREVSPAVERREKFYRPELDAVRFVAFLLVFCNHTMPQSASYIAAGLPGWVVAPLAGFKLGGAFGVDLFFLLSAYLITGILLREERRTGTMNLPAFWIRRICRIWPLYFLFLGAAYWIVPRFIPDQNFTSSIAVQYAIFIGNFAQIGAPAAFNTVAGILWSVSIEEQFYAAWPLLLRFFRRYAERICLLILLIASGARTYLVFVDHADVLALWYNTLTHMDPIAVGALVAFRLNGRTPVLSNSVRETLGAAGFASIALVGMLFKQSAPLMIIGHPLVSLAALAILLAALGAPWSVPAPLVYLGKISYGLYVFHVLAVTVVRMEIHNSRTFLEWTIQFPAALLLTIALAALSYRFVETPFLRLKERFNRA